MVCSVQMPSHPVAYMQQHWPVDAMSDHQTPSEYHETPSEYHEICDLEWRRNGEAVADAVALAAHPVLSSSMCLPGSTAPLADALANPDQLMFVPTNGHTQHETFVAALAAPAPLPEARVSNGIPSERPARTQAEKEVKRLHKKLHAITKLQERLDSGETLDKLQLEKLKKRHEVESDIANAQKANNAEVAEMEPFAVGESLVSEVTELVPIHPVSVPAPAIVPEKDCKTLLSDLETSGVLRDVAIGYLRGRIQAMSFDPMGCWVVQKAIEVAGRDAAAALVSELHGCVQNAVQSPHGNYIIQRVVEILPNSLWAFVAEELLGVSGFCARNRYGCRVLSRLFEHAPSFAGPLAIIANELMSEIVPLSRHIFAHHVMQSILEHGLATDKEQIARALLQNPVGNAQDRNASYVVESAIISCTYADQQALITGVLGHEMQNVPMYVRCLPGMRILKALASSEFEHRKKFLEQLQYLTPQIRKSSQGHGLLKIMKAAEKLVA